MLLSFGLLLILCGLGIMGFGLFIFYAWLPLFYGLLGLEIGLLLGKWLTGDVGTIAIMLGVIGGLAAAASAYFLEPYRRILLGYWGGALVGLSLASVLGLERLGRWRRRYLPGGGWWHRWRNAHVEVFRSVCHRCLCIRRRDIGGRRVAGALADRGSSAGSLIPALLTLVLTLIGVKLAVEQRYPLGSPDSPRSAR